MEIAVRGQQRQVMTDAQLGLQGVDGCELDAGPPAPVAQGRRRDVVVAIQCHQWHGGKPVDDLLSLLRARAIDPASEAMALNARPPYLTKCRSMRDW